MLDTVEKTNAVREHGSDAEGSASSVKAIAGDLAGGVVSMATMVGRQATSTASSGVDTASRMIRHQPITAMAVSIGVGMVLAMVMTRTSSSATRGGVWGDGADRMATSAGHLAQSVSHSAQSAMQSARETAAPVLPAIERVVDTLADLKGIPAPWSGIASVWQAIQGRSKP